MNRRPAQHLKDSFAFVSYLHTEFSHLCIDPLYKLECFILLMSWSQFPVNTVCFVPLTYPTVCVKKGLASGICGVDLDRIHIIIAFTLQNLTHLLGSKLPQSGSFDPHRIHIVNVGSNPLILCSHYTGKWFWCRVDPTSLHQRSWCDHALRVSR